MMTTLPHRGVLGCACAMMALVTIGAGAQTPTQLDGVKPFQAFGTIDPASIAVNITCSDGSPGTRMSGALTGTEIGQGTYTLCVDAAIGFHQDWSAGTLTFARDDRISTFTLHVAIMRLSNYQATATYLGTYDLDPMTKLTGTFSTRLASVSGLLNVSLPSRLLFLNGVFRSP